MFEALQKGQTAEFLMDGVEGLWSVHRIDQTWAVESPAFRMDQQDLTTAMRSALVENLCLTWPQGCRFALNGNDGLCFEYALTTCPDAEVLALVASVWSEVQAQAGGMDFVNPDELGMQAALEANEEDTPPAHLQDLNALQALAESDTELGALLSINEVDGAGVLEPDDESWFIGVRPSLRTGYLTLSLALDLVPEGDQASDFLRSALRLASARRLGAFHTLGCDPEASTLVLSTDITIHHADVQSIKTSIGGLVLLGDRLTTEIVLKQDAANGSLPSLAPNVSDSLAAYQLHMRI